jgi:hypothetical protein
MDSVEFREILGGLAERITCELMGKSRSRQGLSQKRVLGVCFNKESVLQVLHS